MAMVAPAMNRYQDKQVETREGHVLGADHDGQTEIAEHRGQAGNDEQEDHDHAVQGEQGVVGGGLHDGRAHGQVLKAHENADGHAHQEERQHGAEVEKPIRLWSVVSSQERIPWRGSGVEAGLAGGGGCGRCGGGTHEDSFSDCFWGFGRFLRWTATAMPKPTASMMVKAAATRVMSRKYLRPVGS
jgi:hypothetical protein